MAVRLLPDARQQFFDNQGNVLNGGLLFFYAAGSATKQNTYTDSTGGTPNSNPIVLDADGRTPFGVWLTEGLSYKVVLAPANDTDPPTSPIWTEDNIRGVNDANVSIDEWVASGITPTYISGTSFSLPGDQTVAFHKSRRAKLTDAGGTKYGTITASVFGALTTVTVIGDNGTVLQNPVSAVSLSLIKADNPSIDADMVNRKATAVASAATTDIWAVAGDFVHISGTTPITSFGTAPYAGSQRTVVFDGVLTLTHNATTLSLPGGANITTAAGDRMTVRADTTANAIVTNYSKASGAPITLAPPRNRLINGGFQLDQRVNSATSRADDVYCLDRWYILTQTAAVNVTQQTDQENGTPYSVRLTQSQAGAQRMGLAQIIEGKNCKDLRGAVAAFLARIRCSSAQAIRYAILEWTGTEDSVTSDVVNDWTSGTYTAGNFFLAANLTVTAVGSLTPAANTWTDLTSLSGTLGSSGNNIVVFVWTEGTAAQNVTFDIARAQFVKGATIPTWEQPDFESELLDCQRYYNKTFPMATAPAQAAGRPGDWEIVAPAALTGSLGSFEYAWPVRMRGTPGTVTTYSPISANNNARDYTNNADRVPTTLDTSDRRIVFTFASLGNAQVGMHITADAEL